MARRYHILDVFTDQALAGNPLAVVLDSHDLDGKAMQKIAGEFNLSETVFVLAPANADNRAAMRIFTPRRELEFAGHPTVGTASLLASLDGLRTGHLDFTLEVRAGEIPCQLTGRAGLISCEFAMPKLPEKLAQFTDIKALEKSVNLPSGSLGLGEHLASIWNAGVNFALIPVGDPNALSGAKMKFDAFMALATEPATEIPGAFLYCRSGDNHYRARMFAPQFGIVEDPATGSAVAALCGVLARDVAANDGEHRFIIDQGIEMGRPSRIELTLTIKAGKLTRGVIGGSAVQIASGMLEV